MSSWYFLCGFDLLQGRAEKVLSLTHKIENAFHQQDYLLIQTLIILLESSSIVSSLWGCLLSFFYVILCKAVVMLCTQEERNQASWVKTESLPKVFEVTDMLFGAHRCCLLSVLFRSTLSSLFPFVIWISFSWLHSPSDPLIRFSLFAFWHCRIPQNYLVFSQTQPQNQHFSSYLLVLLEK